MVTALCAVALCAMAASLTSLANAMEVRSLLRRVRRLEEEIEGAQRRVRRLEGGTK